VSRLYGTTTEIRWLPVAHCLMAPSSHRAGARMHEGQKTRNTRPARLCALSRPPWVSWTHRSDARSVPNRLDGCRPNRVDDYGNR
jgi:hypothetical protein